MKTRITLLLMLLFTPLLAVQARNVYEKDFVFQKQLLINNKNTCQAFRIHRNWFVTAAHCVESCLNGGACRVQILLAQGEEVKASYDFHPRDIFIPQEYRYEDEHKQVRTRTAWDVALLHYRPYAYTYEFVEGGFATQGEFDQALQKDPNLRVQFDGAQNPKIPVLYTYQGPNLMTLKNNIMVPRWNWGNMEYYPNPKMVLYFGQDSSVWGADGFGVDHGNSGGAVVLDDGGIVGIASAKHANNLPGFVREQFPAFGQADEFFLFTGFAKGTTLKFIKQTLLKFGDRVQTKKLRRIVPTVEQQP
ncbi:MAG: trypsin-like serine protease [Elusimicrobiaceae bacterium]|nr:trypsin-like serine protease [Elusimicrobiaceae bacterium]